MTTTRMIAALTLVVLMEPGLAYADAVGPLYLSPAPVLGATQLDVQDLASRGRQKKIAGAILMGVGAALSVAGVALAIDAALSSTPISCRGREEHTVCMPSPTLSEMQAGYGAAIVGQVLLLAGIPVYIVGGVQAAKAKRLAAQLTFQPQLGATGARAMARLTMRF